MSEATTGIPRVPAPPGAAEGEALPPGELGLVEGCSASRYDCSMRRSGTGEVGHLAVVGRTREHHDVDTLGHAPELEQARFSAKSKSLDQFFQVGLDQFLVFGAGEDLQPLPLRIGRDLGLGGDAGEDRERVRGERILQRIEPEYGSIAIAREGCN